MSEDILEGTKEETVGRCLLERPGVLPLQGPGGEMIFIPLINHTYPECTCRDFEPSQEVYNKQDMSWDVPPDHEGRQCRHCGYFRGREATKVEPRKKKPKSTIFTFPGGGKGERGN